VASAISWRTRVPISSASSPKSCPSERSFLVWVATQAPVEREPEPLEPPDEAGVRGGMVGAGGGAGLTGVAGVDVPLLVGLVVAAIGYLLVRASLAALRKLDLTPRQTVRSLKEDVQWAREQTR